MMMNKKSPNPVDVKVGARVRLARLMVGMSQEALGKQLGLSFQQVQKYEKGTNRICSSRMLKIAQALHQPVTFFYEGTATEEIAAPALGQPQFERIADSSIVTQMLTIPHGIQLARSFVALPHNSQRHAVAELVRAMADAGGRP